MNEIYEFIRTRFEVGIPRMVFEDSDILQMNMPRLTTAQGYPLAEFEGARYEISKKGTEAFPGFTMYYLDLSDELAAVVGSDQHQIIAYAKTVKTALTHIYRTFFSKLMQKALEG